MSGNGKFAEFVRSERERFETEDGNVFAFSFGHVIRYRGFLARILTQHRRTSRRFIAAQQEFISRLKPGRHLVTDERPYKRRNDLIERLHMEIEVFYLLAKIMLDKVAHAVEFYFGPVNKVSLDSHDQLVKNLEKYKAGRNLESGREFQRFASMAGRLKTDVSDFRDYQIAHEKSPRTTWVTLWGGPKDIRMGLTRLYPTANDVQKESRALENLWRDLDAYFDSLVAVLSANRSKTKLKLNG